MCKVKGHSLVVSGAVCQSPMLEGWQVEALREIQGYCRTWFFLEWNLPLEVVCFCKGQETELYGNKIERLSQGL